MLSWIKIRIAAATEAFRSRSEGFAAVEFAMIVPVMIVMFIGTVEMCEAYTVSRRIVTISGSVADLVTQTDEVTDNDLNDIMRIADSLLAGYDATPLDIDIISIIADAQGNPLVDWSYSKGGNQPAAPGSSYMDIPIGLIGPNQSIVLAKATYRYRPPIGQHFFGTVTLSESFHLQPRQSASVRKL